MKELIKELNDLKIIQTSDWHEDIPQSIYEEHFEGEAFLVKSDINRYKHRWAETSIDVYRIDGELIGVHHISDVFSESMGYEDCDHILTFFEVEEIQETTYKIK